MTTIEHESYVQCNNRDASGYCQCEKELKPMTIEQWLANDRARTDKTREMFPPTRVEPDRAIDLVKDYSRMRGEPDRSWQLIANNDAGYTIFSPGHDGAPEVTVTYHAEHRYYHGEIRVDDVFVCEVADEYFIRIIGAWLSVQLGAIKHHAI